MAAQDPRRPCVLLTGAGGAALPGLIEHLQARGYRVLAADMDPNAAGLFFADAGFVIPAGKAPTFPETMRRLCRDQSVDVLVPLVDEELLPSLEMDGEDLKVILPRRDFVRLCLDKLALMRALASHDVPVPRTWHLGEGAGDFTFPLVVKPRTGRGSRDVTIVDTRARLDALLASPGLVLDRFIAQEYIDGPEYTVSVTVWRDGDVQAVVPKRIIEKKGITRLAVTERHGEIAAVCRQVQQHLHADAPFNVQLRLGAHGPQIFEINPRFSTTVSLTMAAGIDELGGIIAQALDSRAPRLADSWRDGLVLVRRTCDAFWDWEIFVRKQPVQAPAPVDRSDSGSAPQV